MMPVRLRIALLLSALLAGCAQPPPIQPPVILPVSVIG